MAMTKEEIAEIHGRDKEQDGHTVQDKCGDCKYKSTCLMRAENKRK